MFEALFLMFPYAILVGREPVVAPDCQQRHDEYDERADNLTLHRSPLLCRITRCPSHAIASVHVRENLHVLSVELERKEVDVLQNTVGVRTFGKDSVALL